MADTKALEELNREVVKLVDELSGMQAKQERLRGIAPDAGGRPGPRRRMNGAEPTAAPAAG